VSVHDQRIDCLRHALRDGGIPALLVTDEANVTYLSGFTGDSSCLLLTADRQWLVTDSRYTEQAGQECPQCELVERKEALVKATAQVVGQLGTDRLAFEAAATPYATYEELGEALDGVALEPQKDLVERLRRVKDEEEIARLRGAIAVAEAAFRETVGGLAAGQSEREVAARLDHAMRARGARKGSFEAIVAAREHSSMPHAQASDAVIQPGDPVLIDWGAEVDLYCSDCTRVVFLAPPDADGRWREVYGIVREAQQRAIDAIHPGVALKAIDSVARDHIRDAGYGERFGHGLGHGIGLRVQYGERFGHGLGHGIGLRVHEAPRFSQQAEGEVEAGMVVTVEPGIYIPGWGGVRIENMIVVREDGAEVLASIPSDLDAMILG